MDLASAAACPYQLAAMISVVIQSQGDAAALARTLANLVPAAVEGAVLDVVVLAADPAAVAAVADAAGAVVVSDGPSAAAAAARGSWLFLLEEGARPEPGWTEAARRWIAAGTGPARLRPPRRGLLGALFGRRAALAAGLLMRKDHFGAAAARAADLESVARGRAAATLAARIVPAEAARPRR